MERETDRVGNFPRRERGEREKYPHGSRTFRRLLAVLVNPGCRLRQQNQRRETKIDDKQPIPGDALLGKWKQHARAKGGETVEKNVTGDCDGVNNREHAPGRCLEVVESGVFLL